MAPKRSGSSDRITQYTYLPRLSAALPAGGALAGTGARGGVSRMTREPVRRGAPSAAPSLGGRAGVALRRVREGFDLAAMDQSSFREIGRLSSILRISSSNRSGRHGLVMKASHPASMAPLEWPASA